MCPNYGAKESSTANIAWGRSNYSVVVRMVHDNFIAIQCEANMCHCYWEWIRVKNKYTHMRGILHALPVVQ